jgi:hypothetical protein
LSCHRGQSKKHQERSNDVYAHVSVIPIPSCNILGAKNRPSRTQVVMELFEYSQPMCPPHQSSLADSLAMVLTDPVAATEKLTRRSAVLQGLAVISGWTPQTRGTQGVRQGLVWAPGISHDGSGSKQDDYQVRRRPDGSRCHAFT